MEALAGAVSIARALLALGRGAQSGVLRARADGRRHALALANGTVCGAAPWPEQDETLGDRLQREGVIDARSQARVTARHVASDEPIGESLVRAGACSRQALELGLRRQLIERGLGLFRHERLDFEFEPGATLPRADASSVRVAVAEIVIAGVVERLERWSLARCEAAIAKGELRLATAGVQLTREAELWPEETTAAMALRRGARLEQIAKASADAARATRFVCALALLGLVEEGPAPQARCALLVRKTHQLRTLAGPRALLDLPHAARPREARRALRQLARELHPDALGPDAAPSLRAASHEVLSALIEAEQALAREARGVPRR